MSGSYELTQNLMHDGTTPAAGCLAVNVFNVTIDLKGFTITGSNQDSGIIGLGGGKGIVIRNGTIRNFTTGIALADDVFCRVESMNVSENNNSGIQLGNDGVVTNSIANDNMNGDGILADQGTIISYNIANGNGDAGIEVTCPSNLVGNTAIDNLGSNLNQIGAGCKRYNNLF